MKLRDTFNDSFSKALSPLLLLNILINSKSENELSFRSIMSMGNNNVFRHRGQPPLFLVHHLGIGHRHKCTLGGTDTRVVGSK